jgi:hypothetical protein
MGVLRRAAFSFMSLALVTPKAEVLCSHTVVGAATLFF